MHRLHIKKQNPPIENELSKEIISRPNQNWFVYCLLCSIVYYRHILTYLYKLQDHDENNSNELLGQSDLRNSKEESVEYDVEAIRNLLNESETYSQEMNKISSRFRTYQHETRNILSENGIMDLSPTSEFVLLYTEEADYDKLIFESIDKIFPEKAHEFLTNFFSEVIVI